MAVETRVDVGVIVVAPKGDYEVQDLCDAIDAIFADIPPAGARGFLLDLSSSSALSRRSTGDLRIAAECIARGRVRFGARLGMVAPSDLAFGMMRQASAFIESQGVEAEVFRDYASAVEWLREGRP